MMPEVHSMGSSCSMSTPSLAARLCRRSWLACNCFGKRSTPGRTVTRRARFIMSLKVVDARTSPVRHSIGSKAIRSSFRHGPCMITRVSAGKRFCSATATSRSSALSDFIARTLPLDCRHFPVGRSSTRFSCHRDFETTACGGKSRRNKKSTKVNTTRWVLR